MWLQGRIRRRFDIGDLILILFAPPPTTVSRLLAVLSDRPILSYNSLLCFCEIVFVYLGICNYVFVWRRFDIGDLILIPFVQTTTVYYLCSQTDQYFLTIFSETWKIGEIIQILRPPLWLWEAVSFDEGVMRIIWKVFVSVLSK